MWAILKIDKKKLNILKNEFSSKLGKDTIFYQPKLKIEKYKRNKIEKREIDILGDYIFCYHKSLSCQKKINQLLKEDLDNEKSILKNRITHLK